MFLSKISQALGTVFVLIISLLFLYIKYKHSYWKNRGIAVMCPRIPFGNMTKTFLKGVPLFCVMDEIYINMKTKSQRYVGIYLLTRNALLILDPAINKRILTTDFNNFSERGVPYNEVDDPLSANLLTLYGEKWKIIRSKLTPSFSSGKLKTMFPQITERASILINIIQNEQVIELKDLTSRLTTDVIGSCAFGIECNSLRDPKTKFRTIGKMQCHETINDTFRRVMLNNYPNFSKRLRIPYLNPNITKFFKETFVDNVNYRTESNVHRHDFVQLLMELMDKDKQEKVKHPLTMNDAAAQAFVFFFAGFETTASALTFSMFELARNIEIQDKLRNEVEEILKNGNGEFTYNAVMESKYLEYVFQESLRMWPVVPAILRKCTQDYQIPDSNDIIEKGTSIIIPAYSFQHDPEYYPNPDEFDPLRFAPNAERRGNDYTYLPFGAGPRNCIGMRFAQMQVKVVIAMLIKHFKFTLNEKTHVPLRFIRHPLNIAIEGLWLNVKPINEDISH